MSERTRGLFILGLAILALFALYRVAGEPATSVALALLLGVRVSHSLGRWIRGSITLHRVARTLRRYDRVTREELLRGVNPAAVRSYLKERLDADGSEETNGDVERFPFSRVTRRRWSSLYWPAAGMGAVSLLWSLVVAETRIARGVAMSLGIMAALGAWLVSRRLRTLDTVLEITPFRITELDPAGGRRTLLLNRPLTLFNEPRRQRVFVAGQGLRDGITIEYDRLGFHRALDLVWRYGGFEPAVQATDAPAE